MKTKEELNALKEKVEAPNKKLMELTDEELAQVAGGFALSYSFDEGDCFQSAGGTIQTRVLTSYTNVSGTTPISCRWRNNDGVVRDCPCPANHKSLSIENYKGRYVFDF